MLQLLMKDIRIQKQFIVPDFCLSVSFFLRSELSRVCPQVLDLIVIITTGGVVLLTISVLEWMDIHIVESIRSAIFADTANKTMYGWWVGGGCFVVFVLSWLIALYLYERRNV